MASMSRQWIEKLGWDLGVVQLTLVDGGAFLGHVVDFLPGGVLFELMTDDGTAGPRRLYPWWRVRTVAE